MTDYTDSPRPADSPADGGTSPAAANGTDAGALAVEERLPARQQPGPATGGDDLDYDYDYDYDYDEADFAAWYEGDLAALTAEDQLPARQDAHAAEGDDPQDDDEAGLTAWYGTDAGAFAVEDRLPPRQQPDAIDSGDPEYEYDEADLATEYDGYLEALTAEDRSWDAADGPTPGSPPRQNGARNGSGDDAADRPGQRGEEDPAAQPHVTHYQANVRGEQLDLWTDGQGRWASDYKRADDALPVDHLADVRSRMGPEAMPATEWADGHAIEVTRDPKDGVWIPGMPGQVPDKAGDVLAGSDTPEERRSRGRDLLIEATRESGDILDAIKENSDLTYEALHHPPEGKAEVPVPAHGPVLESSPHETPIGGMVSGVFAAGIGLWILGEKLRERFTREKSGAGYASDG